MKRPRNLASSNDAFFKEIYANYYEEVFAYILRRVANTADAEEITNAVFQISWQKLDKVPAPPDTRKWLLFVARRTIGNHERSSIRRWKLIERISAVRTYDAVLLDLDEVGSQDDTPIRRAFNSLRKMHRDVLQLIVWDGLSHPEAAEVLGCTVKTLDVRLHRAKAALRSALDYEDSVQAEFDDNPEEDHDQDGLGVDQRDGSGPDAIGLSDSFGHDEGDEAND